jgi:RNA polymerase sigma-70 factor (ECF subfamily)
MAQHGQKRISTVLESPVARDRLVRVASRVLHGSGESEDAAHDAVVQALRAADSFRDQAQVSTWLHRVAVNAALMRLRRRTRAARRVTGAEDRELDQAAALSEDANVPSPGALYEAKQEAARVRAAVDALPALYRDVIRLVVFEEAPLDEAARALGLTPSAVRTRIGRARAQLRERLAS